jgi:peptidyl-prolyl cis-trans isomerase D
MLQKMRDQTQSLAFKVLVGIIVFVLAVFGFGAFNFFVAGDPEVARVNGEGITEGELAAQTERERRRIAAQMGEEFDASLIDPVRLQGAVLDQLIARQLLEQAAAEMGVAVSREQVDRMLVENPTFQINGEFQADLYRQAVRMMGYTPQAFIDETTRMLELEQVQTSVTDTAFVTGRELRLHASLLGQRRDVAYLPFEPEAFREQVTVTDEEVRLRYEENQLDYMTEESVDVAYVTLSVDDLLDDPAIEVAEADVQAAYETERATGLADEQRRSRHILLEVGEDRSVDEAVAELTEIRARIEAGESFAEIAEQVSEDPGSAAAGGDLGFAGRGVFDPAFEEALFALEEPGAISEPVETDFGVHLIALEEIREADYPPFDEVRDEIETRLRREQAQALYEERLRELDSLAFEEPQSLTAITERLGLERRTAEGVTREQGTGPFADPEVRERLFTREVLEDRFNSAAIEYGPASAVVARVEERHEPEPIPFEEVAGEIREAIESERARNLAREAQAAALARLEAGESTAEVAADYDTAWRTHELVRRTAPELPSAVLDTAFSLPRPGANDKSIGEAALPGGGLAVVAVTRVQDAELAALPESEVEGMEQFLADRASRLEFNAFFESLREEASIRRP